MKLYAKLIWIILLVFLFHCKTVLAHNSFVVSFQSEFNGAIPPSTDEWIEFLNEIPSSKEFTACHWLKPKYFNRDISITLWSYCTIDTDNVRQCLQISLQNKRDSANRDLVARAWIPLKEGLRLSKMDVKHFLHRSWVHFCWGFSSVSRKNKFYYNGNLLGIDVIEVYSL